MPPLDQEHTGELQTGLSHGIATCVSRSRWRFAGTSGRQAPVTLCPAREKL